MPQQERVPNTWERTAAQGVSLQSKGASLPFTFNFEAIRPNVFCTTFFSDTHPLPPHPSVSSPLRQIQAPRLQ